MLAVTTHYGEHTHILMSTVTHDELAQLFECHAPAIRRLLARKLHCPDTAADLVQEAFLRLTRHESPHQILDLPGFLYRTALNLATDHLRREHRQQTDFWDATELAVLPDPSPAIEDAIAAEQKLDLLRTAIAELSPLCQQIFKLNRLQGYTHEEVAKRLNISQSTVQNNLSKALLHGMRRLQGA